MTGVPAYKVRRRMRERAAFFAAVQARTHRPAALGAVRDAAVGAVAIHPSTVPPERGGAEGCEVWGMARSFVANVVPGEAA
jgi:hypothetical protein